MQSLKSIDFQEYNNSLAKEVRQVFNEPSPRPTHINLHKGQYTKYQTGIFWLTGLFLPNCYLLHGLKLFGNSKDKPLSRQRQNRVAKTLHQFTHLSAYSSRNMTTSQHYKYLSHLYSSPNCRTVNFLQRFKGLHYHALYRHVNFHAIQFPGSKNTGIYNTCKRQLI